MLSIKTDAREALERETADAAHRTYALMAIWSLVALAVPLAIEAVLGEVLSGATGAGLVMLVLFAWVGVGLYTAVRIVVLFVRPSTKHRIRLTGWASGAIVAVAVLASGNLPENAVWGFWVAACVISAVVTFNWTRQV